MTALHGRSNPLRLDPTRSTVLRKQFAAAFSARFARFKSALLKLVVEEDAFGLAKSNPPGTVAELVRRQALRGNTPQREPVHHLGRDATEVGSPSLTNEEHSSGRFQADRDDRCYLLAGTDMAGSVVDRQAPVFDTGVITNQRFRFLTDAQKVQEFQSWLKTQVEADLFEQAATNLENAYWRTYVEQGYRKGAGMAFDAVRKPALQDNLDFYRGTREQFLRQAFGQPVAIEKVKLLASRVFTELKGVTEFMAQRLTRNLTDGMAQGQSPRDIGREMAQSVGISKNRATLIARTEFSRANTEGNLDALENLGVEHVGVAVEWNVDGNPCPLCVPMNEVVMTIFEMRGMIPRHPGCLCVPIPANVGESTEGQQRSKTDIQKAIRQSLKAERPKRTSRSIAEQAKVSTWPGGRKRILKNRPKGIL